MKSHFDTPSFDLNYILVNSVLDESPNKKKVKGIRLLLERGASVNQSVDYWVPNFPHSSNTSPASFEASYKRESIPLIICLILQFPHYEANSLESNTTFELIKLFISHDVVIEDCLSIGILLDHLPILKKFNLHEGLLKAITAQSLGGLMIPEFFDALLAEMPSLIEAKDADGCTSLAFAIFYNNSIAVDKLLQKGADIQAPCNLRVGALRKHFAGTNQAEGFEKYLRDTFGDEIKNVLPFTQIELAVLLNRVNILERLKNHASISLDVINKNVALASYMQNNEVLNYLARIQRNFLISLASHSTLFSNAHLALSSGRENQVSATRTHHFPSRSQSNAE